MTIAAVGAALLVMLLWFLVAIVFRRRFQFSLRSLLLLVVVVAIPCSWLETEMKAAREQRAAVEEIRKLGGRVRYDYEPENSTTAVVPPYPAWMQKLFGDDLFADVIEAEIENTAEPNQPFNHTGLSKLNIPGEKFKYLRLAILKRLPLLQNLKLDNANVRDAELENLQGLTRLRSLALASNPLVSDEGLMNLRGLPQLRKLWLVGTSVTGEGFSHLKHLPRLEELYLGLSPISNSGLKNLEGMVQLRILALDATQVTDAGLEHLGVD